MSVACGDFKYIDTPINSSWYPTPTTNAIKGVGTQNIAGAVDYSNCPELQWGGDVGHHGRSLQQAEPENTVGLFNISNDPGEHVNLKDLYPSVVDALVAKIEALEAETMEPCNYPGGSCANQDVAGLAKAKLNEAWVPWVKDEL